VETNLQLLFFLSFSYTKQIIADLLQNKIDMAQLVITKALSKTGMDSAVQYSA